ncbi:MAG: FAD-dependent oxidoreductase, partial [Candidatus Bipolaricaulota bacterium]
GGNPASIGRSDHEVQAYIDRVDAAFTQFGAPDKYSGEDAAALEELGSTAARYGIEFIRGRQRHMGTAHVRSIIDRFYHHLQEHGIECLVDCRITAIERTTDGFTLRGDKEISAKYVVAAPGRAGAYWFREEATKLGIATEYGPIDVGVRVEFPAEIYAPIERVMYDAKFRVRTETYDDMVRTFCTNPRGFVVREAYEEFSLVNGHAENDIKTSNTNVALLSHIALTNPVEDTTEYGRAIAKLATTIGGGRPIVQRLKDLQAGRRSTPERLRRATIAPTLADATPGDISMALPSRVTANLLEGLEKLDAIMPGLVSDNTLLYAPEIKFYDTRYPVTESMETPLPGLFVAGDASGHCRGIVYSALTGLIAGEAIRDRASS